MLDDYSETPFMKCSQESERRAIAEKLQETFAWLNEEGDSAETLQYLDKRNSVESVFLFHLILTMCRMSSALTVLSFIVSRSLERPIIHRYKEIEEFPQALNNSQKWNWSTRMFLTEAKAALAEEEASGLPSKYTKEELDALEKTLKEHETWLNEWVERQKSVKMNEDPVILTSEMRARAKTLENHLQKLVRKKVPKPKKTTTTTTTTTTSTSSAESEETVASESEEEGTQSTMEGAGGSVPMTPADDNSHHDEL